MCKDNLPFQIYFLAYRFGTEEQKSFRFAGFDRKIFIQQALNNAFLAINKVVFLKG